VFLPPACVAQWLVKKASKRKVMKVRSGAKEFPLIFLSVLSRTNSGGAIVSFPNIFFSESSEQIKPGDQKMLVGWNEGDAYGT